MGNPAGKILGLNQPCRFYEALEICVRIINKKVPSDLRRDYESRIYAEGIRQDLDLVRKVVPTRDALVLDLGCGKGHLSAILSGYGYSVIGLDIPTTIGEQLEIVAPEWHVNIWKELKRKFDVSYCLGDGRSLPIRSNHLEAVLAYGVIEHISNGVSLTNLLNNVERVLKPGGLFFVFRCPRDESYAEKLCSILKLPHHQRRFSETDIIRLLMNTGLRLIKFERMDIVPMFPPKFLQQIWNLLWPFFRFVEFALLKTPLARFSHNLRLVAMKKRFEETTNNN